MHRPIINWDKVGRRKEVGTLENRIFIATKRLIEIRSSLACIADHKNITWLNTQNIHVAGYSRFGHGQELFCLFNFSSSPEWV
jgi:amylosucrase